MKVIIRLLPAFFLLSFRADGGELRYGAALHEALWEVSSSRLECRLSQVIPQYGSATFVQRAKQDLRFELRVHRGAPAESAADLASVPPTWMHTTLRRDIGAVPLARGELPLVLPAPMARRLLTDLEQGLFPTVSYKDWADGRDRVVVAVSAVNLRKALDSFHACIHQLLPHDFKDMRSTTLQFEFASSTLTPAMRRQLDALAEYLLADSSVQQVLVRGHTDSVGFRRQNLRLSERRAKAVTEYLSLRGVEEHRFKVDYAGERQPVVSNRTATDRARNRRVDITLSR
jgi:outer membrane protein OmpA-like peptidoglycan-associated protein